jgi:hypothetical protein
MAGATPLPRREKNHLSAEVHVREGAGGLLLLAAANETSLLVSGRDGHCLVFTFENSVSARLSPRVVAASWC